MLRIAPFRHTGFVCKACQKAIRKQHTSASPEIFDVVTVGGGPVGLALLAALKSSPVTAHLRCALIEAQDLSKAREWHMSSDQYSNRASSLTPTNVSFLDSIGAWQHVDQTRVQAYDEMQVWDAANDASIQFDWRAEATKYNAPPRTVATMTENANLTRGLLNRISELGADDSLLSSTMVSSIDNGVDDTDGINLSTWPVISTKRNSSSPSMAATSSAPIAARLLIGADGFNSPVRTYAGISSHGWDYNRHGLVATLKLAPTEPATFTDPNSLDSFFADDDEVSSLSNRATAFQRFLPSLGGPIAVLPLPDNHASLVWSTTPQIAQKLKSLSASAFVATVNAALHLNQTDIRYMLSLPETSSTHSRPNSSQEPEPNQHATELAWRLQHTSRHPTIILPPQVLAVQEGTIASFPLRLRHATSLTSPHVALAGDAAHTVHPLAGQGLNLGLADAACLAETITYAVQHGMDIGDAMTLERYSAQRFWKGLQMAMGVDGLNWVYQLGNGGVALPSSELPSTTAGDEGLIGDGLLGSVVSRLRGVGMGVIGGSNLIKGLIMKQAD